MRLQRKKRKKPGDADASSDDLSTSLHEETPIGQSNRGGVFSGEHSTVVTTSSENSTLLSRNSAQIHHQSHSHASNPHISLNNASTRVPGTNYGFSIQSHVPFAFGAHGGAQSMNSQSMNSHNNSLNNYQMNFPFILPSVTSTASMQAVTRRNQDSNERESERYFFYVTLSPFIDLVCCSTKTRTNMITRLITRSNKTMIVRFNDVNGTPIYLL